MTGGISAPQELQVPTGQAAVQLLRADPHHWGEGQVHEFNPERMQTFCGRSLTQCPGKRFIGPESAVTCKACVRSIEARERREAWRQEWQRRCEEDRQRKEIENRRWWAAYNEYLQTPAWRQKRRRVLDRANDLCEGCGLFQATQVHHLRYPAHFPGTWEWIRHEKLFDLRAVCDRCHEDIHDRV